jgi:hypothetical protein
MSGLTFILQRNIFLRMNNLGDKNFLAEEEIDKLLNLLRAIQSIK